jgi:hypothetical protein
MSAASGPLETRWTLTPRGREALSQVGSSEAREVGIGLATQLREARATVERRRLALYAANRSGTPTTRAAARDAYRAALQVARRLCHALYLAHDQERQERQEGRVTQ